MEITISGWTTPDKQVGEIQAIKRETPDSPILCKSKISFVVLDKDIKNWVPELTTHETVNGKVVTFQDEMGEYGDILLTRLLRGLYLQDLIQLDVKEGEYE